MIEVIKTLYSYDSWATERLLNAMGQLTKEQYNEHGCNGPDSIKNVFAQHLSYNYGWIGWLDGQLTPEQSLVQHFKPEDIETVAQAKEKWTEVHKAMHHYISKLPEKHLHEIKPFASEWINLSLPLYDLVINVAVQGIHTRAQIVSGIRRFGLDAGQYEMNRFSLKEKA